MAVKGWTFDDVDALLRANAWETEELDFKEVLDPKTEECAKDVAALANHRGGVLLIGVQDQGDKAGGIRPDLDLKATEQKVQQACLNHLRPAAFAGRVVFTPLADPANPRNRVLVVAVAPSAELVAVCSGSDREIVRFPVRTGRRTRWIQYEEAVRRMEHATRGNYLRFVEVVSGTTARMIQFASTVSMSDNAGEWEFPTPNDVHGRLDRFDESSFIVELGGTNGPFSIQTSEGKELGPGLRQLPGYSTFDIPSGKKISVPWEFLGSVWTDPADVDRLHLALKVRLRWNDRRWVLTQGRGA